MSLEVKVNQSDIVRVKRDFTLGIPREIYKSVRSAMASSMREARNRLRANVSGGVLNKGPTGRLAQSIRVSIKAQRTEIAAKAGSKLYYGRFWEDGFNRRGKSYAPRKWAEPVQQAMAAGIERNIVQAVEGTIDRENR